MRPNGSRAAGPAARRAWKAPTLTVVAIRAEAKSAKSPGASQSAQPQPPAAPASKLGFAFEMAFPLSARLD
jgi:hypothetical protein